MRHLAMASIFVLIFTILCAPVHAATASANAPIAAETPPVIQHETIVVTAQRIPQKVRAVTTAMTVITQEELAKNQYQSIGDVLRNYGIQVDSYSPNQHLQQIAIRGVRSSLMGDAWQGGVLVLQDGRSIGTDNLAMIPLANVARIEIIRGPGAVQYGTSAVGGVVNVIMRRGSEETHAAFEGGGGSFGTWTGQGYVAGKVADGDYSVGGIYATNNNYSIGGGKMYSNTGTRYTRGYNANLGYTFANEHRLGVSYTSLAASEMGMPGYIDTISPNNYNSRSNYSLDALYEGAHKDWGLSWKGRYFNGVSSYLAVTPDDAYPTIPHWQTQNHYQGSQAQLSWQNTMFSLTSGLDWLQYKYTINENTSYPYGQKSVYDNIGLFALARCSLFDEKLILSGGIRSDTYYLQLQNNTSQLYNITPSAGIAVHATDWLTFKANYSEAYRIPEAYQVLGFQGMFGNMPNHDLQPEKSYGFDVGVDVAYKALHLGATYFQTRFEDKVVSQFGSTGQLQYVNSPDSIWLKGIEGHASIDIGEALDWPVRLRPYINVTHMLERRITNADTSMPYADMVPNVADWDIGYGLNFVYPEYGFTADLRCTYMGKQYVQDWNPNSATYGNVVALGNKTVVDLFLTQRIYSTEKIGTVSIQANVRNIFDINYALIKDNPMPGRSVYVGLRWEF